MFFYFLKRLISSIFSWTGDNFQFNLYHQSDIQSLMILVNCYKVLVALHFLVSLLPRRKDVWNQQLRENFYFCPYKYWNHFFHRFQWWRIPSWQFNIVFLMYTIAVKKNCSLRQLKLTCNWFFFDKTSLNQPELTFTLLIPLQLDNHAHYWYFLVFIIHCIFD